MPRQRSYVGHVDQDAAPDILLNAKTVTHGARQGALGVKPRSAHRVHESLGLRDIGDVAVPNLRGQLGGRIQLQIVDKVVLLMNLVEKAESPANGGLPCAEWVVRKANARHGLKSAVKAQA